MQVARRTFITLLGVCSSFFITPFSTTKADTRCKPCALVGNSSSPADQGDWPWDCSAGFANCIARGENASTCNVFFWICMADCLDPW